jgi:glycine/D-amino acid oxidase-like deaminating enzyme
VTEQRFSGALWPYRLITGILDQLLQKHKGNFHLETNTPVLHVEFLSEATGSFPYSLMTPRGTIRAKHVIHCTNGYSGRLIPGLVGRMFPLKGTMSVQGPGPNFPRLGTQTSWSYRWKPGQIPGTDEWSSGLFYCQQNAHTGDFWIGGETQTWDELLTSDDSFVGQTAEKNLTAVLPKMFRDVEPVEIKKVWSGIMGFTGDGFPLIGRLTPAMTNREGCGEWLAAGYNGHGMDKAWLSGDAVARLSLGEDVSSWLPGAYALNQERFDRMGTEETVKHFAQAFSE